MHIEKYSHTSTDSRVSLNGADSKLIIWPSIYIYIYVYIYIYIYIYLSIYLNNYAYNLAPQYPLPCQFKRSRFKVDVLAVYK